MRIIVTNGVPNIQGITCDDELLFFAKIDHQVGYCVIFVPEHEKIGNDKHDSLDLSNAKVAFGLENQEMEIVNVIHGHKYMGGGGMVVTKRGDIFFRPNIVGKPSTFNGINIKELVFTS